MKKTITLCALIVVAIGTGVTIAWASETITSWVEISHATAPRVHWTRTDGGVDSGAAQASISLQDISADDNRLYFVRRNSSGSWQASPVELDMDAPTRTLVVRDISGTSGAQGEVLVDDDLVVVRDAFVGSDVVFNNGGTTSDAYITASGSGDIILRLGE